MIPSDERWQAPDWHEAANVRFRRGPIGLFAMLSAYYDASGATGDVKLPGPRVLGVAGFLAGDQDWSGFVLEWRKMLDSYCLEYAHMAEFVRQTGPYADWPEPKRRLYIRDCVRIIDQHVRYGAASVVVLKDFGVVAAEVGDRSSAFLFASMRTMLELISWGAKHAKGRPIAHVFEAGDTNGGELWQLDKELMAHKELSAGYRRLAFAHKERPEDAPVQAADFLAWEATKYIKHSRLQDGPARPLRKSAEMLLETGKIGSQFWNEAGLRRYLAHRETLLDRRTDDPP